MKTGTGFSYVQARIQARHGRRPDDSDWSRLESTGSAHAYLEAARTGVFTEWADGLSAESDVHHLESALRRVWRRYLYRIADWVPEDWQVAVSWCEALAGLPAAAHVARGGEPAAWMEDVAAGEGQTASLDGWREAWHERMPSMDARSAAGIETLERAVGEWIEANRDTAGATASRAAQLRGLLEHRTISVFRRHALEPGALFAHLLLSALDLQRFRGGLLRRAALAAGGQAAA